MPTRALAMLLLVGCGGAPLQSIKIVNRTDRAVEEVFVYPLGAADHGKSRGALAPAATMSLSVAKGNVEITAVSAKVQIDEHTRERRTASSAIELKQPVEVDIYDTGAKPADVAREGVIGVELKPGP